MILVKSSFEILTKLGWDGVINYSYRMLQRIEAAGRTCYKSEEKISEGSAEKFVARIIQSGHHSVLEHENISVKIICDRGVTHEIVRHRLVAYSQESTRYCNYKGGVTFVIPPWVDIRPGEYNSNYEPSTSWEQHTWLWFRSMLNTERHYKELMLCNWSPQQARSVLPNSLKTEIVMTANIREWRHILKLRTSSAAHPQMREIMLPILAKFKNLTPVLFDNL